ncbi:hypothetical protein PABG_12345 [Paracoccidioides brasiliensis Pb03]|nr:hypothetical protein PABG_12345 [Paracoccidioides brasiliensis Pb03]
MPGLNKVKQQRNVSSEVRQLDVVHYQEHGVCFSPPDNGDRESFQAKPPWEEDHPENFQFHRFILLLAFRFTDITQQLYGRAYLPMSEINQGFPG